MVADKREKEEVSESRGPDKNDDSVFLLPFFSFHSSFKIHLPHLVKLLLLRVLKGSCKGPIKLCLKIRRSCKEWLI